MLHLLHKLKCLKNKLKCFRRSKYGNVHKKVDILRSQLYTIQKDLQEDPFNPELQLAESKIKDEFLTMLEVSLKLLKQQNRI